MIFCFFECYRAIEKASCNRCLDSCFDNQLFLILLHGGFVNQTWYGVYKVSQYARNEIKK